MTNIIPPDPRGLYYDVPNEVYQAGPGLSVSGLKRLRKSPFHFHAPQVPGNLAPLASPTPAMFNGTLTHCALLEPDRFDSRYLVGPEVSKNSNAWKDFAKHAADKGLEIISAQQRDAAFAQAASVRALPDVAELLTGGTSEVSCYWVDEETGVLCRCRPDRDFPIAYGTSAVLLDLKTCVDASPDGFGRQVANLHYDMQAAWYCDGYAIAADTEVSAMVFAAVENSFPFAAAAYMLDPEDIAAARRANRKLLRLYRQCEEINEWPGYPREMRRLSLPAWNRVEDF